MIFKSYGVGCLFYSRKKQVIAVEAELVSWTGHRDSFQWPELYMQIISFINTCAHRNFTSRGIKKRGRVRNFFNEKSMTVEMKGNWGEMRCLKPMGIYNGSSKAKSC